MTSLEHPVAHNILLVDDDHAVREMMTVTLEHNGFEVVDAAANVSEALRFITCSERHHADKIGEGNNPSRIRMGVQGRVTMLRLRPEGDAWALLEPVQHVGEDARILGGWSAIGT
jgi:CheY-like chemotaxis protein